MRIRLGFVRGIRGKLVLAFSTLVASIAVFVFVFFPSRLERQAMHATVSKATAIRDMTAYSLGAALYFADTTAIHEVLAGAARAEDVAFLIVRDTSGRVLATRTVGAAQATDLPVAARGQITDDGLTYITSSDIRNAGEKVGALTVGISLTALRAEVANARRVGGLMGLLIMGIGVLVVYAISQLVTRPLIAVAETVDRIAAGDLSSRASETGDLEIRQLVRAFNHMVDALVGTQAELATMNEELEHRVVARTTELTATLEEHRRSQMALALSEIEARRVSEVLQSLIDVAPQAIIATDFDWRITRWNRAAERLFGWTAEEVLGKPLPYIPEDGKGDFEITRAKISADETDEPFEITRMRKDGSRIDVLVAAGTLRDQEHQPVGYIVFTTDLTARKQLEEQLRQSQKMEAMGRLAGGIAHDFNNLLTVITAYSELLLLSDHRSEQRGQLEQIAGAAARAAALTRQLLTFTRQQIVQLRPVDVSAVAQGLAPMLRRVLRANISFTAKVDSPAGVVKADPSQLEQVLMNLVVNAADAMPQGGALTVETRLAYCDGRDMALGREMAAGNYAALSVSDTGVGMSDQTISRIFEPFFTTKEVGQGTGLGLATTYGIVTELGGGIRVRSRLGEGTTFEVFIPVVVESAPAPRATSITASVTRPAQERGTILLVEDEPFVRRVARRGLEILGYRVLEATDGDNGLTLAAAHAGEISAVVTDVMMPGMGGRELASRLAVQYPKLGVVYISGYAELAAGDEPMTDVSHAFVQKPFTMDQLGAAIESVRSAD